MGALDHQGDPALHQPSQHHLRHRLPVPLRDLPQQRGAVDLRSPLGQRRPRLEDGAVLPGDFVEVPSLMERMHLALVDRGRDIVVDDEVEIAIRHEVRHPDRADDPLPVQLFEGPPRPVAIVEGLVQQIQVHVVQPQPAQRLLEGPQRGVAAEVAVPDLGGDEQLVARQPGGRDHLTDRLLIAVQGGRVDQPIPGIKSHRQRGAHLIPGHPEHAQTHHGHLHTIVEGDRLHHAPSCRGTVPPL